MSLLNSDEDLGAEAAQRAEEALEELAERESVVEREGFVFPVQPPAAARPTPRRGRFLPNLLSNIGFFGFSILLGLWYTPYLIKHLGTAGYGIVPLVQQIVNYMQVLTVGLNAAVGRYLTIALERSEEKKANLYFNTSLFGSLVLIVLLIFPSGWAALNVERLINVPEGELTATRWFFACAAGVFLLNTVRTPFSVSTFCLNRFDLSNLVSFIERVIGVAVVVVCFSLVTKPEVWMVGVGLLLAAIASWFATVHMWRRLTPQLHILPSYCSKKAFWELFTVGSWVSIHTLGAILYLGIDLIVVNRMFGPDAGGRYAAVLQWSALLRTIAGVIAVVFGPTMVYYYARNDIEGLILYTRKAVKLMGLLTALPIGLICGFSMPLLETWLGPKFTELAWLMSLMTIQLSVTLAIYPLCTVHTVLNRVRVPAIVTLVLGAGNLGLAILLAGPMGWGLYGVAAAGAFALIAKNLIFTPLYTAHILQRRWYVFLREFLPLTVITLGTAAACKGAAFIWDLSGWTRLTLVGFAVSLIYTVIGYWMVLNGEDRQLARSMILLFGSAQKRGRA